MTMKRSISPERGLKNSSSWILVVNVELNADKCVLGSQDIVRRRRSKACPVERMLSTRVLVFQLGASVARQVGDDTILNETLFSQDI
jgi:hypothetical protein